MNKKKIILMYPISVPIFHGATLYIDQLANCIKENGHEVTVVSGTSTTIDNSLYKNIINRWSLFGFLLDSRYVYIKSLRPDIVVIVYPYKIGDIAHYLFKLFSPKTKLVTIVFIPLKVEFPLHSLTNIFLNLKSVLATFVLYATSSKIIFHDPKWHEIARRLFFWKKRSIKFTDSPSIPKNENFLEYDVHKIGDRLKHISKKYGINEELRYYAFAGFWTKSKGFDRAIRALDYIQNTLHRKDIGMIVVGGGQHPDEKIYHDLIKKYGLSKPAINIISDVSDSEMLELMASCNIFCAPYRKVLIGRSTISIAASLGMPIVASKYRQFKGNSFLQDEVNSILVTEGDIPMLSESIVKLIDNVKKNESLSLEMKKISHQFGWNNLKNLIVKD